MLCVRLNTIANSNMTNEEWDEMVAIKNAINYHPAAVHPEKMEEFTRLFVQSLGGKGDPPLTNKTF